MSGAAVSQGYDVYEPGDQPVRSAAPTGRKPVVATPYVWTPPAAIPTRKWLYGRHLLRKFVSATVAPGGVGKTSLGIAESLAMVSAKDLLGHTLPKAGKLKVWYLNLEDPREETTRQIQAAALHYGLVPDDVGDRLYVDSGREQEFVIAEAKGNFALICAPVVDSIIEQIRTHRLDCVVVDPFVSSHAVSENDNAAMDLVVKQWGKVAEAGNCAIHLVHHTRKMSGDVEVTAESSRGAKALTDGCRSVRAINRMTREEGERAGVGNHRLHFRTYNDKANLAPPAEQSEWYQLESVSLGNGGDDASDEVGVVTTWSWPDPFDSVNASHLPKVQAKIKVGEWKESSQASNWAGFAVAEVLGMDPYDPADKAKIRALLKEWIKNGALLIERRAGANRHMSPYVVASAEDCP
ncbi:MAG TPA: AAA family ATPase [Devosia sp.]|uniref:AAA family ATPase n=1 Tax=Devosia sp. TaxID=1871048 RepID=UPI002F931C37